MKRALIVGSRGQDGRLLDELLRSKGYDVSGLCRQGVWAGGALAPVSVDVADFEQVRALVAARRPAEIYYLAAFHHSSQERGQLSPQELWARSMAVNATGPANFLEAVRTLAPATRFFYAGTCLAYGQPDQTPQNEATCFRPRCIYSISKTAGMHAVSHFRNAHGLFAVSGILFNHESHLRPVGFLSRKVVRAAWRIAKGLESTLTVGSLDAATDWGYAPDFVDAFRRALAADAPADYVLATGQLRRVGDWVEQAFACAGLDWRNHVREDAALIGQPRAPLVGDSSLARIRLGWTPATHFERMVALMYEREGSDL